MKCTKCNKTLDPLCQYDTEIHHHFVCHLELKIIDLKKQLGNAECFIDRIGELRSYLDYRLQIGDK
jgi:hypothetical protein